MDDDYSVWKIGVTVGDSSIRSVSEKTAQVMAPSLPHVIFFFAELAAD